MKIALFGNPNTGKSSIFNQLTGMRQHVGNFPGVTVDKKSGTVVTSNGNHELIDFPGTYSIYPHSEDESVVYKVLSDKSNKDFPELAVVVVDASNLRRNLLLFTQIYDLGIPCVLVLNMQDVAKSKGMFLDINNLQAEFPGVDIVETNARSNTAKRKVIRSIEGFQFNSESQSFIQNWEIALLENKDAQEQEAKERFKKIDSLVETIVKKENPIKRSSTTQKLDALLTHKIFGYAIFGVVLLTIFQFIFSFASVPMDFIDEQFGALANWVSSTLPDGVFNDLLSQGIVPGIGGVVIFIPQIALLFFFIAILEETGYLTRVVFLMDRLMRPFGLNGKSVVPLMSSVACAIPGVMASRTISDWKERLITILVAPLMSCSARIPVYTLLIALVIPEQEVLGFLNLQGLVLMGLYLLGVFAALGVAILLKWMIKSKEQGFLLLEMPDYKTPRWGNVLLTVLEKVKVFVFDAGKVILAISILLWAMAAYSPGDRGEVATKLALVEAQEKKMNPEETNALLASAQLESSYIGIMGQAIEPVIAPLGYDWKMGISLITSFAAREVFVGSLATIYAVNDDGEEHVTLKQKLRAEKRANGQPVYTLASGLSLMVFYVFAMQCMATLAVVKRETKSWKWPLFQLGYMGVLAYVGAWITFLIFK